MYLENNQEYLHKVDEIFTFHEGICLDLFPKPRCFIWIKKINHKIVSFLKNNKSPNHSFVYDQVVSYGELISTFIINSYFIEEKLSQTL